MMWEEFVGIYETILCEVRQEIREVAGRVVEQLAYTLQNEKARVYAREGVARRLGVVERCLMQIFEIFPPNRDRRLTEEERIDVSIYFHAYVINVHGLLDNLAWVACCECEASLRPQEVGFFYGAVKPYLPKALADLASSEAMTHWREQYSKEFRDSLAHRLPPYLPHAIRRDFEKEYASLWRKLFEARNVVEVSRVLARMEELEEANPVIWLGTQGVILHAQLVADTRLILQVTSLFVDAVLSGWPSK